MPCWYGPTADWREQRIHVATMLLPVFDTTTGPVRYNATAAYHIRDKRLLLATCLYRPVPGLLIARPGIPRNAAQDQHQGQAIKKGDAAEALFVFAQALGT